MLAVNVILNLWMLIFVYLIPLSFIVVALVLPFVWFNRINHKLVTFSSILQCTFCFYNACMLQFPSLLLCYFVRKKMTCIFKYWYVNLLFEVAYNIGKSSHGYIKEDDCRELIYAMQNFNFIILLALFVCICEHILCFPSHGYSLLQPSNM